MLRRGIGILGPARNQRGWGPGLPRMRPAASGVSGRRWCCSIMSALGREKRVIDRMAEPVIVDDRAMHSTPFGTRAEEIEMIGPPSCSPEQPMGLGIKDGQREAHPFVFYRLGVDWSSPENRVNDEASDLGGELDLGGLDLGRERALESFDRHPAFRSAGCG